MKAPFFVSVVFFIQFLLITTVFATPGDVSNISLGNTTNPTGVAVNEITNKIYVVDSLNNEIIVINGINNTVISRIQINGNPLALTINKITNKVYVLSNKLSTDRYFLVRTLINGNTDNVISNTEGIFPRFQSKPFESVDIAVNEKNDYVAVIARWFNDDNQKFSVSFTCYKGDFINAGSCGNVSYSFPNIVPSIVKIDVLEKLNLISSFVFSPDWWVRPLPDFWIGSNPHLEGGGNCPVDLTEMMETDTDQDKNEFFILTSNGDIVVKDNFSFTYNVNNNNFFLHSNCRLVRNVGSSAVALTKNTNTDIIYVSSLNTNTLNVIDKNSGLLVASIGVGQKPVAVASNSFTNRVYTANSDSKSVSVIQGFPKLLIQGQFWASVNNSGPYLNLRKTIGTQNKPLDDIIKTVPKDWVLKVATTTNSGSNPIEFDGYQWYGVVDVTDNAVGWIATKELSTGTVYLSYDAGAQTFLEAKAAVQHVTREARTPLILQAVDTYYTQPNTSNSLYGGGGGRYGNNNFQIFIQGANFPKELILAIAATESNVINFDNEGCSSAHDGGIGIMQITSNGYKGLGSALLNNLRINDCRSIIESLSKYYSNAPQGIYANIKDAFRVLQEKYQKECPDATLTVGGLVYSCQDIERVLATWGYNGKTVDPTKNYLRSVANSLATLPNYFTSASYANSDQLIEKLRTANDNRIEFKKFSPVELQVIDLQGHITGYDGTSIIKHNIPFSRYDQDEGVGAVFFPQNPYRYRVIGTGVGTYEFRAEFTQNGLLREFRATNIPVVPNEIHEYLIDWDALDRGERGVTVRIDTDGDGIADRTVHSDGTLTEIEPPVISITSPKGEYILNSQVQVQFTATDALSGIATVSAKLNDTTVFNGQTVALVKPGVNTPEVSAMDNEGNMTQATSTFQVLYTASGFLPPVKADGTGTYNQSSTLPVKFTLADVYGSPVPNVVAKLYMAKINNGIIGPDKIPVSTAAINVGNQFRYDTAGRLYIFNLSTSTMVPGKWQLKAVLDSGQAITSTITIR